ncbi:MAG: hypothetical protein Q8912_00750 [Bacillota bacterium]|nr:hypothetical protein [Bacillota bacterium]MDP4159402.1 hypothetical protein [Bacillota bacterium]
MILLGVISILGVLLWKLNACLEWTIPLRCQAKIESLRKRLSRKTRSLNYVWESWPGEGELEKNFWRLQKELPLLRKQFQVPLWIEVHVGQGRDTKRDERYLSCLQRRYPEIEVNLRPLSREGRETCGDT